MVIDAHLDFKLRVEFPTHYYLSKFPQIRYMGSKYRLLPWIQEIFADLEFDTALDAFSGSGSVSYLLKAMGKEVTSCDQMNFCATIARAIIENPGEKIEPEDLGLLVSPGDDINHFIENTFTNIFFTPDDLRFLDTIWSKIPKLNNPNIEALALSALIRSCVKRQPRGVFTVAGDPERYKDSRRDLKLTLREHFIEQVEIYNKAAFDNGRNNHVIKADIFQIPTNQYDLVYMDPPYVPRSDDNCYMKRYHFLEGLSCYWNGVEILENSKVKKIKKPYTPFSYRSSALKAFSDMFERFSKSILVLSYSSNGYPDLDVLVNLMGEYKSKVSVHQHEHRYMFGTHKSVSRNLVKEYLIIGQ